MINLERDLRIVEATSSQLKEYVLSDVLYWPLSGTGWRGRDVLPRGTLGGMLLRLHQLSVLKELLTPEQVNRLEAAHSDAESAMNKWAVQTEQKAVIEIRARLRSWSMYLEEFARNPIGYFDEYAMQSRGRTALMYLDEVAGKAVNGLGLVRLMGQADRRLQSLVIEGEFVWDEQLRPAYPRESYWWLYVAPKDRRFRR